MKKRILLMLLSILMLTSCMRNGAVQTAGGDDGESKQASDPAVSTDAPDSHMLQLIPDIEMKSGIGILSQKDHANGNAFSVLATRDLYNGGSAPNAAWRLAQWDSGKCLYEALVQSESNVITDGTHRTFSINKETGMLTFALDTSLYYQGRPAVSGDYWPHLLIERSDLGYEQASSSKKQYYLCDSEKMIVSFDIRLSEYSLTKHPQDWVQAAQFLMYFYVKGTDTNDFCWFGLQLFDNRWELNDHYIGYDGGKPDASSAMIYSVGSKYLYKKGNTLYKNGKPCTDGDFVHVEIDIAPYLKQMLKKGKADGYFKAESLSELCINGMNLGWETIGTFKHTMQIKNIKLESYR